MIIWFWLFWRSPNRHALIIFRSLYTNTRTALIYLWKVEEDGRRLERRACVHRLPYIVCLSRLCEQCSHSLGKTQTRTSLHLPARITTFESSSSVCVCLCVCAEEGCEWGMHLSACHLTPFHPLLRQRHSQPQRALIGCWHRPNIPHFWAVFTCE